MKHIITAVIFVTLLFTANSGSGQSETEYDNYHGWSYDRTDSPELNISVAMRCLGFGYPYVEGMIKSIEVTGFHYEYNFYTGNDLGEYGIVFPLTPSGPYADIEFTAFLLNPHSNYSLEKNHLEMTVFTKVNSATEVPFDKAEKEKMKEIAKSEGIDGGAAKYWETYGGTHSEKLINVRSATFHEIRAAIKRLLKDQK